MVDLNSSKEEIENARIALLNEAERNYQTVHHIKGDYLNTLQLWKEQNEFNEKILNKNTSLVKATWVLSFATWVLAIATIVLVIGVK